MVSLVTLAMFFIAKNAIAIEEIYDCYTADGVRQTLTRQKPPEINSIREPVILCHGFDSNRFTWDLQPGSSLEDYLAYDSFDNSSIWQYLHCQL